jgi:oligopeptide/dipeptide ABC transporter ATP-binding protein
VRPVRSVSFELERGKRLGLVGESGSGKTLTALALMRLVPRPGRIEAGEVLLKGRDLLAIDERAMGAVRGREVAMVYQNPLSSLNPVMTIGEQLVEAIRAHDRITETEGQVRAIRLLRDVGVPEPDRRIHGYPHQLSGGMRQRVVIAMAMSTNPDVLIADEATTALDVITQARILELLLRLVEERGTAVILITHDLGVARGFCTDVRVMYAGRIVEEASRDQFYAHPTHPYSEALLQSMVRLDADLGRSIPAIPGQPPLPGRLPSGCPFHPRCPAAIDICRDTEPGPVRFPGSSPVMAECHRAAERYRPAERPRAAQRDVDVDVDVDVDGITHG